MPDPIRLADRTDRRVITGEHLRCVAMPLGGIGTGVVALAGDGGWRQWQMHNRPNHLGHVPNSFFAVYTRPAGVHFSERKRPEDLMGRARVLMSDAVYDDADFKPSIVVSDHIVPDDSRRLLDKLPGVGEIDYVGEYPVAEVTYRDESLPFPVTLTAWSPFAPLDEVASGYPAIVCTLRAENTSGAKQYVSFAATLQNPVGWDGIGQIRGTNFAGFGGNVNRVERMAGLTAIEMTSNRLARDDARWGQMSLTALHDDATYAGSWGSLDTFWSDFSSNGELSNTDDAAPSDAGSTVCGALARGAWLEPGESFEATFVLSWYFPNHYVNWNQTGFGVKDEKSKFWIGTHYGDQFAGALDVARSVASNMPGLAQSTFRFRDTFHDSTLPYELLDAVTSQASIIRSPTCLWLEDGTFQAFEGCHGASTGSPEDTGGCCPLNCTHVWNYEQALARLFPRLEQTMRRVDLGEQMRETGEIGFRTKLPLYLERWIDPAADGQCGTVLKTYREWRASGDREFLDAMYPEAKRAVQFMFAHWDEDRDGLLSGEQHNTYDINLHGWSSFTSSMYLAALRAASEMATLCNDSAFADECAEMFERGSKKLVSELWNGEYFHQKPDPERDMKHQYGTGCHIDQILGQWWAHVCDLGHILPEEHVRTALQSIVANNWRRDFVGFKQTPRVYASESDEGTLACSWPHGGKPDEPTLYSDEVWNGLEYQLASSLLFEGFVDDALKILRSARNRYDGRERNPWNEVECGDHYARSMSSWTLLESASGYRYDAGSASIAFAPRIEPEAFRAPFFAAQGWGTFDQRIDGGALVATLAVTTGSLTVATQELAHDGASGKVRATLNGAEIPCPAVADGDTVRVTFAEAVTVEAGGELVVTIS